MIFGGIKKYVRCTTWTTTKRPQKNVDRNIWLAVVWRSSSGKSLTAFYHSHFLPTRWNIDFRIAGYSAYCRNGWMTREEALQLMQKPPHIEEDLVEYVKKRLGFSDENFDDYDDLKTYKDYKTYKKP